MQRPAVTPSDSLKATDNEKSTTVKDNVMDAAVRCFTAHGISKTSMEGIARESGISRSTIYRHFVDRDDLILAILEREAIAIIFKILPRVDSHKNIGDFIIEGMLEAMKEIPNNPALSILLEPDSLAISSRIMLMADRLSHVTIDAVGPMVNAAKKTGILRKSVTTELLVDWVIRNLFSLLTIPSSATQTETQKRHLLEVMLLPAILENHQ